MIDRELSPKQILYELLTYSDKVLEAEYPYLHCFLMQEVQQLAS